MRFDRWLLCTSLALPAAAALAPRAASAQAQPTEGDRVQARQSFREGVAAYQHRDFTAALAAFQTAYRLAPHPSVRVNMANCFVQLHQPAEALSHFEQFLAESPSAPAAQRAEVERQVAELRRQLGELRVRVEPDSVLNPLVLVDSRPVSTSGPVRLATGHHVVEISADGYSPERREIDVTAGGRADVDVRLRPVAAASAAVAGSATGGASTLPSTTGGASVAGGAAAGSTGAGTEPRGTGATTAPDTSAGTAGGAEAGASASVGANTAPTPAPRDVSPRRGLPPGYFIAAAAVTGVAGLTALGCGIGALVANGTFENAVSRINSGTGDIAAEQQRGHDAAVTARSLALVTDISLVVTGVAAITGVVLLTQTRFNDRPVTVTPVASSTGAGLSVGGRF